MNIEQQADTARTTNQTGQPSEPHVFFLDTFLGNYAIRAAYILHVAHETELSTSDAEQLYESMMAFLQRVKHST